MRINLCFSNFKFFVTNTTSQNGLKVAKSGHKSEGHMGMMADIHDGMVADWHNGYDYDRLDG